MCSCACRQKQDKHNFIAGKARDVNGDHHASYSLHGKEIAPEHGYIMCQRNPGTFQRLDEMEMKWCFQEQPVGLLT